MVKIAQWPDEPPRRPAKQHCNSRWEIVIASLILFVMPFFVATICAVALAWGMYIHRLVTGGAN